MSESLGKGYFRVPLRCNLAQKPKNGVGMAFRPVAAWVSLLLPGVNCGYENRDPDEILSPKDASVVVARIGTFYEYDSLNGFALCRISA